MIAIITRDKAFVLVLFSALYYIYLVSIYDRSIIKASIVNHPFKEIKFKQFSFITSSSFLLFIIVIVDYQPSSYIVNIFGRGFKGGGNKDLRRNKLSRDHE